MWDMKVQPVCALLIVIRRSREMCSCDGGEWKVNDMLNQVGDLKLGSSVEFMLLF